MSTNDDKPLTRREWERLEKEKDKAKARMGRNAGLAILGVIVLGAALLWGLQILACGFMPAGCH